MSTISLATPPSFFLNRVPSSSPRCLPRASTLPNPTIVESSQLGSLAIPISLFPASCDQHLRAACNLRVRTFYDLRQTYRREEYIQYLTTIEFEALKEKIHGKRTAFGKVQCVLATVPSMSIEVSNEESLLPLKGHAAELRRGYLSNVCVAKQMQRKGIGKNLVMYAKRLALSMGITDLYTHVVLGNVSAENLYAKCGFVQEGAEKHSEAKLAGRPPHLLLWQDLTRG